MGNKQSRAARKQGIYTAPSGSYIPPSYGPAYQTAGTTGGGYGAGGGPSGYGAGGAGLGTQAPQRSMWYGGGAQQPATIRRTYGPSGYGAYPSGGAGTTFAAEPTGLQYYPQAQPVTMVQEAYQPPVITRRFVEQPSSAGFATGGLGATVSPTFQGEYEAYDRYGGAEQLGAGAKMQPTAGPGIYTAAPVGGVYAEQQPLGGSAAGYMTGGQLQPQTRVYQEVPVQQEQQQFQQLQQQQQQQPTSGWRRMMPGRGRKQQQEVMTTGGGQLFQPVVQEQPYATAGGLWGPQQQQQQPFASTAAGETTGWPQVSQLSPGEQVEVAEIRAVSYSIQ